MAKFSIPKKTPKQVVDVEPKRLVLLVKGQLLPRPPTDSHPAVEMHMAPCLLTDVSGRLVFSKDTKMFLIPVSVVEKSKCVRCSGTRSGPAVSDLCVDPDGFMH